MKHAFLILAHTDFPILQRLLSQLDDERNDVYIHFDSKVTDLPTVKLEKAGLFLVKKRINVHWGDLSVVEAEYSVFEEAVKNGPYEYYHLLSGVDLCLRTQDEIHEFFNLNRGKEFIGYTLTSMTAELERKVLRWHLFPKDFKNKSIIKRIVRAIFLRTQEALGIRRNKSVNFKKGSQWVSITEKMAERFLEKRDWALKTFTHTFCADEVVMQTICWNSDLKDNIYNTKDDGKGCVRAISWFNGEMRSWKDEDIPMLMETGAMFARKFCSEK